MKAEYSMGSTHHRWDLNMPCHLCEPQFPHVYIGNNNSENNKKLKKFLI